MKTKVILEVESDADLDDLRHDVRYHILEVTPEPTPPATRLRRHISELGGLLSDETAQRWQKEVMQMRNEWERDF